MKKIVTMLVFVFVGIVPVLSGAAETNSLSTPAPGVICDSYLCVDVDGVSNILTTKYLGAKKGKQLAAQDEFDRTAFTFTNGVHCDIKEKVCRKNRYFDADGNPSGAIDGTTTQLLFGQ
ncbi:YcgJ family protein [Yersinia kristensenii]|uniref:Fels-1 Prophage Protein-like n=1 Tax=Yersinia kristensenii TaxID=28152 RepID=A0AB73Q2Q5_YERKR|nr:YcgJ family protein [Yersinia kristensenii]OVZ79002.1 hypothetical protein CBW52_18035 [Yersinia kristensenii]